MKKYLFLITLFLNFQAEDFQMNLSNRSVDFIYSLLPVLSPIFKEREFNGFAVIDIDYFISVQLQIEKMILHSLELGKSDKTSMRQINENEYVLTFPELSLSASCDVKVTKGMFSDLGLVKLLIKKFLVSVTIEFQEQGGELLMVPKNYQFDFEKFGIDIENPFIKYIWKILADHDFVKKYVMKKIGQKISSYIDGVNLYQLAVFKIEDQMFLFGLSEQPQFIDDNDQFYIITKIDLTSIGTKSTPLEIEDGNYKNLMFSAKVPKISQLIKLVANQKKLVLNSVKQIADKLTVQNLQLAFPHLADIYADKMDTKIQVELTLDFDNREPLINRDYNTFMFQNVEINLKELDSQKQVCTLVLNSFLNLMISSADVEKSILYINMPNMRIIDLEAKDCIFNVQTTQYKNILENLFKMNLLGKRKFSFQDYQQVATGPYVYTTNDKFYFGVNIELDI